MKVYLTVEGMTPRLTERKPFHKVVFAYQYGIWTVSSSPWWTQYAALLTINGSSLFSDGQLPNELAQVDSPDTCSKSTMHIH